MERTDAELVAALRAGDEDAFRETVRDWHASLLHVAQMFVPSRAIAEDVVQETWVRVLGALDRFEGRSSLKTWVFRILVNTAKTRGRREGRSLPFSALPEATVEAERFLPDGHWASPPPELPEDRLLAVETRAAIAAAIEALPEGQRAVISLRDVEGWSAEEVRNALGISEVNQRVLLHRARARVRQELERYLT